MSRLRPSYTDGDVIAWGGVRVRLKVNRRARRILLRIDPVAREVVAVAPAARHLKAAADFASSRREWILGELGRLLPLRILCEDDVLSVLGQSWRLIPDGRRLALAQRAEAGAWELHGCGAGVVDPLLVRRAIKSEALTVFGRRVRSHCRTLGLSEPPPLRLMDARTRWGSCTPGGPGRNPGIRLSWRLALAPFDVADYVVAHECAHLLQANHGPQFWRLVRTLVRDERAPRSWLRRHGAELRGMLQAQ